MNVPLILMNKVNGKKSKLKGRNCCGNEEKTLINLKNLKICQLIACNEATIRFNTRCNKLIVGCYPIVLKLLKIKFIFDD